jgi:D-alanyl-D-alanine carboxypeptidase
MLVLLATLGGTSAPAHAEDFGPDLQINSKHYIVIDADTGEVFASRDADDQVAMASLTKVFTSIQALEEGSLDQVIVTDDSDLMDSTNSTMGFPPNVEMTLEDLLYGLMLPSGNDAAHAIARTLGAEPGDDPEESVDRFVARLNQRIKDTGLNDTHLVNPSGYGVPGHYTTAHDLATWMMYALKYPMFETLISTLEHTTTTGQYLRNNNRLMTWGFEELVGGKTGFDNDSGYCLIEVARRNGNTMVSVTLDGKAPDDWYDDNRVLLQYALDAKEAREADGDPITNPTLAYLDPDAAVISRTAIGGSSIGVPLAAAARSAANDVTSQVSSQTSGSDVSNQAFSNPATLLPGGGRSDGSENIWVVLGVVALVIAARSFATFATPYRSIRAGRGRRPSADTRVPPPRGPVPPRDRMSPVGARK